MPALLPIIYHRALLKTHHITSRSKLSHVIHPASRLSLSLVLKTGRTPGILIAEGHEREAVLEWVAGVKEKSKSGARWGGVKGRQRLRYKNLQVLRVEAVDLHQVGRLQGGAGVREFTEMKELGAYLRECGVLEWWRRNMGYIKSTGDA